MSERHIRARMEASVIRARMRESAIRAHVQAINDCNQRGGRMLSLLDLIDAGSVDLSLAAYLAAAMRFGASVLVGAHPGGAGKTAVMCALLNFLPDHTVIRPVDRPAVLDAGAQDMRVGESCYLAHEIGAGSWYAYVWGRDARAFFRLAAQGHTVASNLHADTLQETTDQLCRENGVAPAHLNAVTLKIYLRVSHARAIRRWVHQVYESDGRQDRLLWMGDLDGRFSQQADSVFVSPSQVDVYVEMLSTLRWKNIRHIEAIRRHLVCNSPVLGADPT